MKPTPVDSFHGGMIDEFDAAPSHYAQRLRNYMIDGAGKLYERPGTTLWSSLQTPTVERITNLKVFQNLTKVDQASQQWTAFAYSNQKIWASTGSNIDAATGPTTWTELVAIGATANPAAFNASILTRAKMQQYNNHIYAAFFNRKTGSTIQHPRIKKIFPKQDNTSDAWLLANLGLPRHSAPAVAAYGSTPGSGNTYVYYAVLRYQYSIGSTTYVTLGAPSPPRTVTDKTTAISPGNGISLEFTWPYNNDQDKNCYPLTGGGASLGELRYDIYRTKAGETLPRYAGSLLYTTNATDNFDDTTTDAQLGEPIYTADGTVGFDEPPPCKLFHVVNDTGYFGHFGPVGLVNGNSSDGSSGKLLQSIRPSDMCIIQGVPGVIDSAPADFTIPTPAIPIGISSIDYHPIVFCENSCWRVDGQIDAFGNGAPVLRPISETVGLLDPNGIIPVDRGLIFIARDGAYLTDGFTVKLITGHVGKFWAKMCAYQTPADLRQMSTAFDPSTKKFFMSHRDSNRATSVTTVANTVIVGDLGHQNEAGQVAVSELHGELPRDASAYPFHPTFLESFDDTLLMGDLNGYIVKMDPEPQTGVGSNLGYDIQTSAMSPVNTFGAVPVVSDYISVALDLGNSIFKKWATKILLRFKMPLEQTKIFAQVISHNDGSFREGVSSDTSNGKNLKEVRELSVPSYRRIYTVARKFAKEQIRCLHKQIQIKKSFTILYASIPDGTRAYAKAVTAAAGNTAQLTSGTWPTDIVGQTLYLASDSYSGSWAISAVSGDTVTVYDPLNTFPTNASPGVEWQIKGYPKDVKLGIHGYTILSHDIQGHEDHYQTTDAGSN